MDADYDDFEIVWVIGGFRLVDAESYERDYWSRDGRPLRSGYYVVTWSRDVRVKRFDKQAVFYGPLQSRSRAQKVIERLQNLRTASVEDRKPIEPAYLVTLDSETQMPKQDNHSVFVESIQGPHFTQPGARRRGQGFHSIGMLAHPDRKAVPSQETPA